MDILFVKNPSGSVSNGLEVKHPTGALSNTGPEGSVVVTDKRTSVCLSPQKNIPIGASNPSTEPIVMEGDFVIEVDGVVLPFYFKEDQLPNFFNEQNTQGYGIVVTSV